MTKIIITVGPSSAKIDTLKRLKEAGADSFRVNLSHMNSGRLEEYIELMQHAGIKPALDTQGAQIRVTGVESPMQINQGDKILLCQNPERASNYRTIQLNHRIFKNLERDDILKLDFEGALIKINKASEESAEGIAMCDGDVLPNRAIDVINKTIELNHLSNFDIHAIKKYSTLMNEIYLSFTSNKKDMHDSKSLVEKHCGERKAEEIGFIAKIETKKGIANINEIIDESDGILIDRGDLSRELSISKIPGATDALNKICQQKKIPFFVATNILDSMMSKNCRRDQKSLICSICCHQM